MQLGYDAETAKNALRSTNGDVDRAAELLLAQGPPTGQHGDRAASNGHHNNGRHDDEEAALQRAMQESLDMEEQRRKRQTNSGSRPNRAAAVHKAGEAAMMRAAGGGKSTTTRNKLSSSGGLTSHHPDVKVIPKLQDKSKEEQILRCADRLKSSPQAVDTLYRALTTVNANPDTDKFRKVDKTTPGYKRSLANAPGAEDFLMAMNFRPHGTAALVLDRSMVDPALLYLGISALEQTKLSNEYKEAKQMLIFSKAVKEIMLSGDSSETEAIQRAQHMAKCPTEPTDGRGALMQVVIADETIRRRFDGDDTLGDVLHWLGGHGTAIPDKIKSREWSLVDLNRYPIVPIDCSQEEKLNYTLQYIGCWPSGRLEVRPSTESWMRGSLVQRGSSRGLGSAPTDQL